MTQDADLETLNEQISSLASKMFSTSLRALCLWRSSCRFTYLPRKTTGQRLIDEAGIKRVTCIRFCANHASQTNVDLEKKEPDAGDSWNESKHVPLTEDVIQQLAGDDPQRVRQLKLIEFEYEVAKQEGLSVPDCLSLDSWKELLTLSSHSARKRYFTFLFKKQCKINNEKRSKLEKQERQKKLKAELAAKIDQEKHLVYNIGHNSIFIRIWDSTIERHNNNRVIQSSILNQPLVFDLSYHEHMTRMEQNLTVAQLCLVLSLNREHKEPLPLVFCNADPSSYLVEILKKRMPTIDQPDFPITLSSSSYLGKQLFRVIFLFNPISVVRH